MSNFRKYEVIPLEESDLERVTEINFNNMINELLAKLGNNLTIFDKHLSSLAINLGLSPSVTQELTRKSFADQSLPASREELIEIYYRSGATRRHIMKVLSATNAQITNTITKEKTSIRRPKFSKHELRFANRLIRFYTGISEVII